MMTTLQLSWLNLRRLGLELGELEADIGVIHGQLNNAHTQKLSKEVQIKQHILANKLL